MPRLIAKNAATTVQSTAVSVIAASFPQPVTPSRLCLRRGAHVRGRENHAEVRKPPFAFLVLLVFSTLGVAPSVETTTEVDLGIIPRPAHVRLSSDSLCPRADVVLRAMKPYDAAARELVAERWNALGIREAPASLDPGVRVWSGTYRSGGDDQMYTLDITPQAVTISKRSRAGEFDAFATIAQLARNVGGVWRLPCVHVEDAPALRWRILSDDVSRGPLPTMRYFKERIRTIAAFKMNGYSPYMEHVFVDPKHPLPAPLDGITPAQLRELDAYARRFHVAFIPEQQTFAHMHNTLRWERYAPLAELPHGYLISPANSGGERYVRDLIADELRAVPDAPFFHIGSDEPLDLGHGLAKPLVAASGEGLVYTKHVVQTAKYVIAHSHARPMIWDDAVTRHPELFDALPKSLVFVTWHYGSEPTYLPYIERIKKGGFEQMVAPGALNWNEIYPDLDRALPNIGRFVGEGKRAHVLGLFQTVWHDDGETLFEATWYPVIYAAASAWEQGDVDIARFRRDFPRAFFGTDDMRYAADLADLGRARTLLQKSPRSAGDILFWSDPFAFPELTKAVDLAALRLAAERVIAHARVVPPPPLHANAAAVMQLAARRYDLLGRNFQIASEARSYYDDARTNADGKHDDLVYRALNVAKYSFWEQRDALLELEPLVKHAWEYENRSSHESSVLERYHLAAQRAIVRADRIDAVTYRDYTLHKMLPSFEEALGLNKLQ
jgi:hexosaminidase